MGFEKKLIEIFGDDEPGHFGTGWWSGILSFFFGQLSLGSVIVLHWPHVFASESLRSHYPMPVMRLVIQAVIVLAIVFGIISSTLRRKKILGLSGMLLALCATTLGGASVPINETLPSGPGIGLDWFLLDMLLMTLIYSPIEVLWPAYPKQGVFREEWTVDIAYFLSTHLPIRVTEFLILAPATALVHLLNVEAVQGPIGRLPWVVQFLFAIVVADLTQYALHRALHTFPVLWRFHAIHHSSLSLDWIAGSRSHLIDDVIVRGGIFVPMMLLFSQDIIIAYTVFVTLHATWTHCNFGPSFKWLEPFIVVPRYHHWHHTSKAEGIDKNYAIHFPIIDKLFGTHHLPETAWPEQYGLTGEDIPRTFWAQSLWPFWRPKKE